MRLEAALDLRRCLKLEGGTRQDWCPDLAQGQGYQLVVGWQLALQSKGGGGGLDLATLSVFLRESCLF